MEERARVHYVRRSMDDNEKCTGSIQLLSMKDDPWDCPSQGNPQDDSEEERSAEVDMEDGEIPCGIQTCWNWRCALRSPTRPRLPGPTLATNSWPTRTSAHGLLW